MSKNRRVPDTSPKRPTEQRSEVIGVVALGAALFLLISMISLQAHALVMGPFGRSVASLYYGLAGVCGYLLIVLAAIAAVRMLLDRDPIVPAMIWLGTVLGVVALATLVHLCAPHYRVAGHGPVLQRRGRHRQRRQLASAGAWRVYLTRRGQCSVCVGAGT